MTFLEFWVSKNVSPVVSLEMRIFLRGKHAGIWKQNQSYYHEGI